MQHPYPYVSTLRMENLKKKEKNFFSLRIPHNNAAMFGPPPQLHSSFILSFTLHLSLSLSIYMWLVPPWSYYDDSDGNNLKRLDRRTRKTILRSLQKSAVRLTTVSVHRLDLWLPALMLQQIQRRGSRVQEVFKFMFPPEARASISNGGWRAENLLKSVGKIKEGYILARIF